MPEIEELQALKWRLDRFFRRYKRWKDCNTGQPVFEGFLRLLREDVVESVEMPWGTPTHRHYKGGLYRLIGAATDKRDGGRVAVYEGSEGLYVRDLAEFEGTVEVDGQTVRRFDPLAPDA